MTTDDEVGFSELFERHRHGVHAFLRGRLGDPEAARDLLQETFLRLWRRYDEVAALDDGRQRAWLYTVARNLVVDRYRSDATRRNTVTALAGEAELGGEAGLGVETTDLDERVHLREQVDRLDAAIARLPEDQRVVLTMTAVAGMSSREIGDALDLPAGTVRSRLHQARTRLAATLETTP